MKVLILNGSPHKDGNLSVAINEMKKIFDAEGDIDVDIVDVGNKPITGCKACYACNKLGECCMHDLVNQTLPKFKAADGVILASPVYYAAPNGTLMSFCDRLFFAAKFDKRMKVGASIVAARRGGCSATYDTLNKFFGIAGMPIASSQYWNMVHGAAPGEANQDLEGLQTMRSLARNMVFLMKSIQLGKTLFELPPLEEPAKTSFIR